MMSDWLQQSGSGELSVVLLGWTALMFAESGNEFIHGQHFITDIRSVYQCKITLFNSILRNTSSRVHVVSFWFCTECSHQYPCHIYNCRVWFSVRSDIFEWLLTETNVPQKSNKYGCLRANVCTSGKWNLHVMDTVWCCQCMVELTWRLTSCKHVTPISTVHSWWLDCWIKGWSQ